MNVLEQVVLGWQAMVYAMRQSFRGGLWLPWLLLGLVQLKVIALFWWFAHPLVSWLMVPLLRVVAGEDALHYPNVFRAMPGLYSRIDLVVTPVLGALAAGASTVLFAATLGATPHGPRPRALDGLRIALRRAVAVILVNLPLNLLVLAFAIGIETFVAHRGSSGLIRKAADFLALGGALVLQAWFVYGTALVVLGGRSFFTAWRELPRAAARGFWAALFLGFVATLPLMPLQQIARHGAALIHRGRPELLGWLVVVQVLVTLVTSFVLTGGVTVVYQTAVAPTEPDAS